MEVVWGIAIGGAIETLVLIGVAYIGMRREDVYWDESWSKHKRQATDRVRADRERWRCMDNTCVDRQQKEQSNV